MNKALLWVTVAVVAVAIAVIGVRFFGSNDGSDSAAPASDTPATQNNEAGNTGGEEQTTGTTITYTADGFKPTSLEVKRGTTVTFKNDSSFPMWVATDPHPQHTEYPGFDANKAFTAGQSYSFTFDNAGSWGFHNHLRAGDMGTIVVR